MSSDIRTLINEQLSNLDKQDKFISILENKKTSYHFSQIQRHKRRKARMVSHLNFLVEQQFLSK